MSSWHTSILIDSRDLDTVPDKLTTEYPCNKDSMVEDGSQKVKPDKDLVIKNSTR